MPLALILANDTDLDSSDAVDASTLVVVGAASNGSAVVNAGEILYLQPALSTDTSLTPSKTKTAQLTSPP